MTRRRQKMILWAVAPVGLLLLAVCIRVSTRPSAGPQMGFGLVRTDFGFALSVTNSATIPLGLEILNTELKDAQGRVNTSTGTIIGPPKTRFLTLSPNETVQVNRIDRPLTPLSLRFTIGYSWDAGSLRNAVSSVVSRVPGSWLPRWFSEWLKKNGWIDGRCHRLNTGPWVAIGVDT